MRGGHKHKGLQGDTHYFAVEFARLWYSSGVSELQKSGPIQHKTATSVHGQQINISSKLVNCLSHDYVGHAPMKNINPVAKCCVLSYGPPGNPSCHVLLKCTVFQTREFVREIQITFYVSVGMNFYSIFKQNIGNVQCYLIRNSSLCL